MVTRESEKFVATWSVARPLGKIFRLCRWALALAWLRRVSCRGVSLVQTLPIALALLPPLLVAVLGVAIALAGLPTPPAACLVPTGFTAIARLWMLRPE
jgi:hypothetical protein